MLFVFEYINSISDSFYDRNCGEDIVFVRSLFVYINIGNFITSSSSYLFRIKNQITAKKSRKTINAGALPCKITVLVILPQYINVVG